MIVREPDAVLTNENAMIKQQFFAIVNNYIADTNLQNAMWQEIETSYSKSGRHYHTLAHLNAMLAELEVYKHKFTNWDTIIFAIAYHDIVYNTLKSNNEERSADLAVKRLKAISIPEQPIAFCRHLILATKKHEPGDEETNLFTDADLSILGADAETYRRYSEQIRQEYAIYPDLVYNPGRKKVLMHFLAMPNIYKTKEFAAKYEAQARINIETELDTKS